MTYRVTVILVCHNIEFNEHLQCTRSIFVFLVCVDLIHFIENLAKSLLHFANILSFCAKFVRGNNF